MSLIKACRIYLPVLPKRQRMTPQDRWIERSPDERKVVPMSSVGKRSQRVNSPNPQVSRQLHRRRLRRQAERSRDLQRRRLWLKRLLVAAVLLSLTGWLWRQLPGEDAKVMRSPLDPIYPTATSEQPSLAMKGGDPYLRALMRTISASEANVSRPYYALYGGRYAKDLDLHPDRCIAIAHGRSRGHCTTAAGRYQMLTTTWLEKAERYHPNPSKFLFWQTYSFAPKYQDAVVYAWLSDRRAWGVNLSQLLRAGKLDLVLRRLSRTWTSLGYGSETNTMTAYLPLIYQQLLQEELHLAQVSKSSQEREKEK